MKYYSQGFLPVCFSLSAHGHGIPRVLIEEIRDDAFRFKAEGKGYRVGSDVPNISKQYPSFKHYSSDYYQIWIIKKGSIFMYGIYRKNLLLGNNTV